MMPGAGTLLRFAGPAVGLSGMAVFAFLYLWRPAWYFAALTAMGFKPWHYPFLDGEYWMASVECTGKGIDIYLGNPCDVLNRANPYSPLWGWAAFLPTDKAWTAPLGTGLDAVFFLSLAVLPPARRLVELPAIVLTTFSYAVCYAAERANADILLYLMALGAGLLLLRRDQARFFAYPVIVLAGLLKFYPLALLVLALRERRRAFLAIAVATGLATGAALLAVLPQLREMAANIPRNFLRDAFGGDILPSIMACAAGEHADDCASLPDHPGQAALANYFVTWIICLTGAALLARAVLRLDGFARELAALGEAETLFLAIGGIVVAGCFFAGRNVDYRQVFFLMTVPGFLALTRAAARPVRRLAAATLVLIVFLMWKEAIHVWWDGAGLNPVLLFVLREVAFWAVIAVLLAVLWRILSMLPTPRAVLGRLAGTRA